MPNDDSSGCYESCAGVLIITLVATLCLIALFVSQGVRFIR